MDRQDAPAEAPRPPRAWELLLVLAAAVLPLLPVLRAEFVYDDQLLIVDRLLRADPPPSILELVSSDLFGTDAEGRPATGYWRPVVSLSYGLERLVFGAHPFGYHLDNVLLHAGACVLLLLVLRGLPRLAPFALVATLLFAVHPVHLESLAPVSGRTDPLGTFLALLAAFFALRGRLGFALLAFALALGAKESIAVLGPVVAAVPWLARGRPARREALLLLAGTLLLSLLFFAVKVKGLGIVPPPDVHTGDGELAQRFLTFLGALPRYAALLAWPADLSIVHEVPLVTSPADPWLLLGVLLLFALLVVAGRARAPFAAGAALLLWTLLPASNVVPITYAFREMPFPFFERYLYVPSIGFALLVAGAIVGLGRRVHPVRAHGGPTGAVVLAVVLAGFGARGAARADEWRNDVVLYEQAVRSVDDPAFLLVHLANARFQRGDVEGALGAIDRALDLDPLDAEAGCGKAMFLVVLAKDERFGADQLSSAGREAAAEELSASAARRLAEARRLLSSLLEVDPRHGRANEAMGMVAIVEDDLLAAARWFERAWFGEGATTPALESNYLLVARRLAEQAREVLADDDPKNLRAKHFYENAIRALTGAFPPRRIAPPIEDVVVQLLAERADALWMARQFTQAASGYRVALAFQPELARAYTGLALCAKESGDRAQAYRHLETALKLDPDAYMALNTMFTMLQEDGRTREAAAYYERVLRVMQENVVRRPPPLPAPGPGGPPDEDSGGR